MQKIEPRIFIISEPSLRWDEVDAYLRSVGGMQWSTDRKADLAEQAL